MKKTLFIFCLFLANSIFAQYNLNRANFPYEYRHLPDNYVNPSNRTYYIEYQAEPQICSVIDYGQMLYNFEVPGWQLTDSPSNAYLKIVLRARSLIVDFIDFEEHIYERTDKNGNKIIVKKYRGIMGYSMDLNSYYMIGGKNHYISSKTIRKEYYTENEYLSPQEAMNFLHLNREVIVWNLIQEYVGDLIANTHSVINNKFSYMTEVANFHLFFVSSKKNKDYESQQEHKRQIISIMNGITADGGIEETYENIIPEIIYLDMMAAKYKLGNKKERKIHLAMKYNIALLYFLTEDYENATKYANYLVENDDNDGKKILKEIDKVKTAMISDKVNTRHFPLE